MAAERGRRHPKWPEVARSMTERTRTAPSAAESLPPPVPITPREFVTATRGPAGQAARPLTDTREPSRHSAAAYLSCCSTSLHPPDSQQVRGCSSPTTSSLTSRATTRATRTRPLRAPWCRRRSPTRRRTATRLRATRRRATRRRATRSSRRRSWWCSRSTTSTTTASAPGSPAAC